MFKININVNLCSAPYLWILGIFFICLNFEVSFVCTPSLRCTLSVSLWQSGGLGRRSRHKGEKMMSTMRSLILGDSLHSPAFHLHQLSLWLAWNISRVNICELFKSYTFSALYPGGLRGDCHGHSHPLCAPWIRWVPHHSIVRACLSSVDFMANGAWTREGGGQCPNHWWLNACLKQIWYNYKLGKSEILFKAFLSKNPHLRVLLFSLSSL